VEEARTDSEGTARFGKERGAWGDTLGGRIERKGMSVVGDGLASFWAK